MGFVDQSGNQLAPRPIVGRAPAPQSSSWNNSHPPGWNSAPAPQPQQASVPQQQMSYASAPSNPASLAPVPPAPPVAPSIDQFLRGDTTYMGQEAALKNSLANYNTSWGQQNANYAQDYALNKSNLGLAKIEADRSLNDDYAGRGMMNSGLYMKANTDQQAEYDSRQLAMNNAQTSFNNSQTANKNNFATQEDLSNQKAKSDAINRRALQYNITG
jgi:hypothetical protein